MESHYIHFVFNMESQMESQMESLSKIRPFYRQS